MRALALILALAAAACEEIPPPKKPTVQKSEAFAWLNITKESCEEVPDSPEQVLVILKTSNGKKWVATWEETR